MTKPIEKSLDYKPTEVSLSDRIVPQCLCNKHKGDVISAKDVKGFIMLLKAEIECGSITGHDYWINQIIDKRAGDKLI